MNRNTIIAAVFALVFLVGQSALAQGAHDLWPVLNGLISFTITVLAGTLASLTAKTTK